MAARVHPGAVRHVWDHFVLGVRGAAGETRLSLYAIAWSPELGGGHVAFLDQPDGNARAWADVPGLGKRMQRRLGTIGWASPSASVPVTRARFERLPSGPHGLGWSVTEATGRLVARWSELRPAFWSEGPAPAFWDQEDLWACFLDGAQASLELDGRPIDGTPWLDDVWVPKLGRALWSAHVALAEVRVEPARETMAP